LTEKERNVLNVLLKKKVINKIYITTQSEPVQYQNWKRGLNIHLIV